MDRIKSDEGQRKAKEGMNKRKAVIIAVLFGQFYFWMGALFISILFHLFSFYSETAVTYITEVFYYLMQAAGIFFYAILVKNSPGIARKRSVIIALVVATLLLGSISFLSGDGLVVLISGAMMNICIGALTSVFLTRIAADLQPGLRGITFGAAYALGSVGTYLISLPSGGQALQQRYIIYVYIAMALLSVAGSFLLKEEVEPAEDRKESEDRKNGKEGFDYRRVIIFLVPVLLLTVYSMGYHFEQANAREINIVFTRAFYAFSLLLAGFINDRSRKSGAICAMLALGFPLVSLIFRNSSGYAMVSSILSYLFLGFLAVYRVVLFADYSRGRQGETYLAGYGIAGGLIGNGIGTTLGLLLEANQTVLAMVTLMLYILFGFLFFLLYNYLYTAKPKGTLTEADKREQIYQEYLVKYGFNSKQAEVLKLLLDGHSNCEIGEKLYLAESTVKYHVKNILKITGYANRNDLVNAYLKRVQDGE